MSRQCHRLLSRLGGLLLALLCLPTLHAAPQPTILVFGDSISAAYGIRVEEGWVSLLQKKLTSQGYGYRVVNASVSGETTGGGLARLPRALERHRPAILILELGGNDALRGLPLADVRTNLDTMIRKSRAAGTRVVLAGMRMPPNYGPRYTQEFQTMYADLSRQHQVPLIPFVLEDVALKESLMQADGMHPNAKAQPLLLDEIWPRLAPLLERG
ncbi:MAG TPA: arylesterase [Steroidobacteraceae bacterium]|nr:arylesterase [Steroidobacteraceae bacterium]